MARAQACSGAQVRATAEGKHTRAYPLLLPHDYLGKVPKGIRRQSTVMRGAQKPYSLLSMFVLPHVLILKCFNRLKQRKSLLEHGRALFVLPLK